MFDSLKIIASSIGGFLLSLWWIWLPVILFLVVKDLWLKNVRQKFIQKIDWVLLEIRPPREIRKTPRAMEQFFAALHGFQRTPNFKERNFLGHVQEWFSLEIIGQGGEIHFFIRTLSQYRNQVEAQIYAQYPQAEIIEVDDYTQLIPSDIPNKDYDLWGTELILTQEDAYPIRTFPTWEKEFLLEEQRIDPVASLAEILSKLEEGEQIWIQTLIRPVMDEWKKDGEKIKDKLVGRKKERKPGLIEQEITGFIEAARETITGSAVEKKSEKPSSVAPIALLSPAERDVVTAIENKMAKIGFETLIRFVYLGPTSVFNKANVSAVIGCYKQFSTQNLNGFMPNKKVTTKINYKIQLKGPREFYRKKKILAAYKKRAMPLQSKYISYLKPLFFERLPILNRFFIKSKVFVLNIEELATVYHYPGMMVEAPMMPSIEAKKGEPPARLPTK
jgi:hypothetical protein